MPVLSTKEELIAALQNSVFSADPLADLAHKGYTLSPALNKEWEAARLGKKIPPMPRVNPDAVKGRFAFKLAPAPLTAPDFPPGSYDVTVGLTIDAANQALGAVYDSGTIPHQIALDQLLSSSELNGLASFFRVDRPGGQISRLHIRSAPTLAATTDGSSVVAVEIPIQIDWDRTIMIVGRQVRQLVTQATGVLQLTMRLNATVVSGSNMTIAVQLAAPLSPAESPRLMMDANSPVQVANPAPPDQIDQTALTIQLALAIQFQNSLSFPVSPTFTLPIGTLTVQQLDVVATGGALVAGVRAVTGPGGDPSTLANLLPDSTSNTFLQVRDIVPNALLQQEVSNGDLTRRAQQSHSNAVVESAVASFQDNAIVVNIKGKLINQCGFDLGFWATHTTSIQLHGDSIEIDQKDDSGVDTADAVWCFLLTLGLIALVALTGGIFLGVAAGFEIGGDLLFVVGVVALTQFLNGGSNGITPTIVDLTLPIPGSDVLPTLAGGNFQVTHGVMLIAATAGTRPDNVNKHIYVRFLAPSAGAVAVGDMVPLVGAKVAMMNQDVPPPPGEETPAVPPNTSTTVQSDPYSQVPSEVISTTYSFEPPTADQKVAEGVTDLDGTVRIELLQAQFPIAGNIVAETTTSYDADYPPPITSTSETPVPDTAPDLYFLVTKADGSVVDSRQFAGGFLSNLTASQVGSLSNPLTIKFGGTVGGFH